MIRCASCKRFTSNNVALRGFDEIKSAHGDCKRCGPNVPLDWEYWEDWGWSDDEETAFQDRLIATIEAGAA